MSRRTKRLTARTVAALIKAGKLGRHADGDNLYLSISLVDGSLSNRWTFMYTIAGKQREMGLGPVRHVPLAQAREKAAECRSLLSRGTDPLEHKRAARIVESAKKTFGRCADELIAAKSHEWRSPVHAHQWRMTLDKYCEPIHDMSVDKVDTQAVLSVLNPPWQEVPETASRLRGRIEAVLDSAKAQGLRTGENPAAWKGHLALILPKRQRLSRGHHAAMAYVEVPAFIGELRSCESIPARALEFTILTAVRLGEALGARWDEFDLEAKVWIIPPPRMKSGIEFRSPVSGRVLAILEAMAEIRTGDFVFPGQRPGRPLNPSAVRPLCPAGVTVHGFRSSFRDWCGNETLFPREIAEQALAHATGNAVETAYRRGDALEKRRKLMDEWASYIEPLGNVLLLKKANVK